MSNPQPSLGPAWAACSFRRRVWLCALLSVVVVVGTVLLLPADLYLSAPGTDLVGQLAAWRAFAADNILAGHFPLWNPYTYSGQPFLGDFQSAELYPPNVIFLFLPLARAANLCFLLHFLLLGWGVGVWAGRRGCHPLAAALAGIAAALSGPVFPHLYSGHMANVCTMAWVPWMFVALEAAWRGPVRRPLLLAAACVCLQILGGHPQYVFYGAVAAGLHAVVCSLAEPALRRRALPVVAGVYVLGALLAAAQLLPGFEALLESVRAGKLDYNFVRMFGFPPENLVTLIAPWFFGDVSGQVYWGRCYLWEVSMFMGVSGLALGLLALVDRAHRRQAWLNVAVMAPLFLLALGDHTPLLAMLYEYVPGFGQFRCLAKFSFPTMLFGALTIGAGADAVLRGRVGSKLFAAILAVAGVVLAGMGVFIEGHPATLVGMVEYVTRTHERFVPAAQFAEPEFLAKATVQASGALALAGAILAGVGVALFLARRWPPLRWMPLALLPLEMAAFAHDNLAFAHTGDLLPAPVVKFVAGHPGDYRVLNPARDDNAYFLGRSDLWGDDPTVLKRYAQFIAYSQGGDPNRATQYASFRFIPPVYALLRYGYAFVPKDKDGAKFDLFYNPDPLPHALLVPDYQVLPGRDAIFAAMMKEGFNPREMVYLEREPTPKPLAGGPAGTVKLVENNSDQLTIEADTPAPALLLITDLYSRDWRARSLPGSTQQHYEILPADYIVRAVPLAAGHHHLVMEYAPPSFRRGLWVSAIAWLGWAVLMVGAFRRANKNASV